MMIHCQRMFRGSRLQLFHSFEVLVAVAKPAHFRIHIQNKMHGAGGNDLHGFGKSLRYRRPDTGSMPCPKSTVPAPGLIAVATIAEQPAEQHDSIPSRIVDESMAGPRRGRHRGHDSTPVAAIPFPSITETRVAYANAAK